MAIVPRKCSICGIRSVFGWNWVGKNGHVIDLQACMVHYYAVKPTLLPGPRY